MARDLNKKYADPARTLGNTAQEFPTYGNGSLRLVHEWVDRGEPPVISNPPGQVRRVPMSSELRWSGSTISVDTSRGSPKKKSRLTWRAGEGES
jgi:hypothetical protein